MKKKNFSEMTTKEQEYIRIYILIYSHQGRETCMSLSREVLGTHVLQVLKVHTNVTEDVLQ